MLLLVRDNFLEEIDVEKYRKYVDKSGKIQSIIEDEKMAGEFWSKYGGKLLDCCCEGKIMKYVTITNSSRPVGRHKDSKMGGEKYKILIYLNSVEKGGTIFYGGEKGKVRKIENKANRCVIFDMDMEHESEKFDGGEKRTTKKKAIGFRVVI